VLFDCSRFLAEFQREVNICSSGIPFNCHRHFCVSLRLVLVPHQVGRRHNQAVSNDSAAENPSSVDGLEGPIFHFLSNEEDPHRSQMQQMLIAATVLIDPSPLHLTQVLKKL